MKFTNRKKDQLIHMIMNPYIVLGLLMFLGAGLRLYWLGSRSLWLDEAKLYWIAQGTIQDIIQQNAQFNSSPPLYPLLISLISSFRESEAALRSISFLAGVLSIPAVYWLSRLFVSRIPAYLSAFLVAVSLNLVLYSQELREYTLSFFLACMIFISFLTFLRSPRLESASFMALVFGIALLTQYGLALLILAVNIIFASILLAAYKDGESISDRLKLWTMSQVFVLFLALIVYKISLSTQFQLGGFASESYLEKGYWDGSIISLFRLAVINTNEIFDFAFPHPSLLYFLFGIGLLYSIQNSRLLLAVILFAIPMVLGFIAGLLRLYPYIGMRQNIHLTPMIFVVVALGIEFLLKLNFERSPVLNVGTLAIVIVIAFSLTSFKDLLLSYQEGGVEYVRQIIIQDIRPVIETLSESYQASDRIYIGCRAEPAFRYYYPQNQDQWIIRDDGSLEDYLSQIDFILEKPGRVWMLFSHCNPGEMEAVVDHASQLREVDRVTMREGAWLYMAE